MSYWKKRFEALEAASNKYGIETYRKIEPAFDSAFRQIESEITLWYERLAKNNGVTMQEARQWLNANELKEFQWDVQEYIKYGRENAINQQWIKELENASAKYHISRLEALKVRTQQAVEVAFGNELDEVDAMVKKIFTNDYYHSIYEMQKGFNIGWEIGQIDERKLEKFISKPWATDGKHFSERIWNSRIQLVSELHNQLTRTCILGKPPDDAIKAISKKFNTSKNQAGRLVMTEQAYFHSVAQQEAFKELDVEEFEVVATLDNLTSEICQEMDGKHFPMKDYEPGVTAPPFHPWCRSVTVPYFDDDFDVGERTARGADGETYYVPSDMKYSEWKEQYVDSPVVVDQTQKITKKKDSNAYSVDRKLVNSKEYHDKFESLTSHKSTNESVYQEAMKMLEHRDGTELEDIVVFDSRTGNIVVKNTLSAREGQTGLTYEQYETYKKASGKKVLLHNHPNGGRLSFTDLKTLFVNADIEASIAVGHNGMVHIVSNPDRTIDIEKLYESLYNEYKEIYANSEIAKIYALDDLYDLKIFDYESR
jgi:SPP1 gp7 family putative phage head morphogenesis protein